MDEIGITMVPDPPKIIAKKGQRQVGQIASSERGELVIMAMAISANGSKVPPFFICPRKKFKDFMVQNCIEGNVGHVNDSGWQTELTFLNFLKHFKLHTKPSKTEPVLILLDNHVSHEMYILLCNLQRKMG